MMALQTELDPIFLKAIALLHSKDPDSHAQLKALVEDERYRRRGDVKEKVDKPKPSSKMERKESTSEREPSGDISTTLGTSDSKIVIVGSTSSLDISAVKPVDTVTTTTAFEVVETVEELSSSSFADPDDANVTEISSGSVVLPKDLDFDEVIEELDSASYLEPPSKKTKVEEDEWVSDEELLTSDKSSPDSSPTNLVKMFCVVCRQEEMEPSSDNIFVECHECHEHFHQKCHKPPISNKDVNDPRLIFYCMTCTKQMKKEMAAQLQQSSSSKVKQQSVSISRPLTNPFQQPRQSIQPFRRPSASSSTSTPNSSSSSADVSKLPGNQMGRSQSPTLQSSSSGSQGSSQRSSPSFRSVLPQDAAMKSMKRLESLKKKAKIQQQMRTKR